MQFNDQFNEKRLRTMEDSVDNVASCLEGVNKHMAKINTQLLDIKRDIKELQQFQKNLEKNIRKEYSVKVTRG